MKQTKVEKYLYKLAKGSGAIETMELAAKNYRDVEGLKSDQLKALKTTIHNTVSSNRIPISYQSFLIFYYLNYFYDPKIEITLKLFWKNLPEVHLKSEFFYQTQAFSFVKNISFDDFLNQSLGFLAENFREQFDRCFSRPDNKPQRVIVFTTCSIGNLNHSPTKLLFDLVEASYNLGFQPFVLLSQVYPYQSKLGYIGHFLFRRCFPNAPFGATISLDIEDFSGTPKKCEIFNYGPGPNGQFDPVILSTFLQRLNPMFLIGLGHFNWIQEAIAGSFPSALFLTNSLRVVKTNNTFVWGHSSLVEKSVISKQPSKLGLTHQSWYRAKLGEKKYLSISDEKFSLGIIGNRLESEIGPPELDFLKRLSQVLDNYVLVVVGKCSENLASKISQATSYNCVIMQYRTDLGDVMSSLDLALNTRRLGGGFTACQGLGRGVLTLTINYGDVSLILPPELQASSYHELIILVEKMLSLSRVERQTIAHEIFATLPTSTDYLREIVEELENLTE